MIKYVGPLALLAGTACAPSDPVVVTRTVAQTKIAVLATAPEPQDGTCWEEIPAPTRTVEVEETVLSSPAILAEDGTETQPAIYRKQVTALEEPTGPARWFERVCADDLTPSVVENLQRALSIRGLLNGPVTGELDAATRDALLAYQSTQGLKSDVLSLAAARQMGLVAVELQEDRENG